MEERRRQHDTIEEKLDAIIKRLDMIENAFPDGTVNHRNAHEQMIAAAKAEERFWSELYLDAAKRGVAGVAWLIVILLGLAITGLAFKLGLGAVVGAYGQ